MTDQETTDQEFSEELPSRTPLAAIRHFMESRFHRSLAVLGAAGGLLALNGCVSEHETPQKAMMAQKAQYTTLRAINNGERITAEDADASIKAMESVLASFERGNLALVAIQNGLLQDGSSWLMKTEQNAARMNAVRALDDIAQVSLTASNSPIFTPQFKKAFSDIRQFALRSRSDFQQPSDSAVWKEQSDSDTIPPGWTRISQVIDALGEANVALRADEGALRPGLQVQELSLHKIEFEQAATALELVLTNAKEADGAAWIRSHHETLGRLDAFLAQVQSDTGQLSQTNHLEAATGNNLVKVNASVGELRRVLGSEQAIENFWLNEAARPQTIQTAETALAALKVLNAERDAALRTLNPNGQYVYVGGQQSERESYHGHGGHVFFYPSYWWNGYGYYGGTYYGGGGGAAARVPSAATYRSPAPAAHSGTSTTAPGVSPGVAKFSGSAGGLSSAPGIPAAAGAPGEGGFGAETSPLSASKPGYTAGKSGSASSAFAPRGGFGRTGSFHSGHSYGG